MNRRQFLQRSAGAAAFFGLSRKAYPFAQSPNNISKFAISLPGLGKGAANELGNYISVATANTSAVKETDYYEIAARKFTQRIHPNLGPTTFLGYADASAAGDRTSTYLGGLIVAKSGTPVRIKLKNQLSGRHPLPVDTSIMGAEAGAYANRITVHLHGGFVHWTSDGGPFTWFDPHGNHGPSFLNGTGVPGEAVYDYPNLASARLVWYHDHAIGYTRLNAYAGLATGYLITDNVEADLIKSGAVPNVQIPLIIQDKTFEHSGALWYPSVYEPDRWELAPGFPAPPIPSVVPEFFSDIALVNGAPYPKVKVDAKRYRFRLLNGSQARFYNLQMYVKDSTPDGITLGTSTEVDNNGAPLRIPRNAPGPAFIQIGTEGGILPAPVAFVKILTNGTAANSNRPLGYDLTGNPLAPTYGNANRFNLLLAPAERADIVIDFKAYKGQKLILYNDAPAPFPMGDPRNDYYPGAPPSTVPGNGPDTRILMQFEVGTTTVNDLDFAQTMTALQKALPEAYKKSQPESLKTPKDPPKVKTLNEDFDDFGRLRQRVGTTVPTGDGGYGLDYMARPTEVVKQGEIQVWRIFNLTGDTHPMHFHLVNVQVLQRAKWAYKIVNGAAVPDGFRLISGTERAADPNEQGWKETVRMNPGEAVDVIMKFDLPPGEVEDSPRLQCDYNIKGAEYVWHCHILEHEEHDMMRTLVVT